MLCYIYTFIEPTTTSGTDTITPTDITSSNNNPPMTPTTHTTATLTLDSNIKKSTTLTPTVHDNTAYTQNTISEYYNLMCILVFILVQNQLLLQTL